MSNLLKKSSGSQSASTSANPPSTGSDSQSSEGEYRARRSRGRLTEEEYEFVAKDIMAKPPMTGYYLKYNLPLKYAARTDEVRWEWRDGKTGRLCHKELIGGGKNSDLDY